MSWTNRDKSELSKQVQRSFNEALPLIYPLIFWVRFVLISQCKEPSFPQGDPNLWSFVVESACIQVNIIQILITALNIYLVSKWGCVLRGSEEYNCPTGWKEFHILQLKYWIFSPYSSSWWSVSIHLQNKSRSPGLEFFSLFTSWKICNVDCF